MSLFDVTQVCYAGSPIREMMFIRRPSRPLQNPGKVLVTSLSGDTSERELVLGRVKLEKQCAQCFLLPGRFSGVMDAALGL